MKRLSPLLSVFLLFPALGLSPACQKTNNVVRLNEVTHSVFYAPLYLAEAAGYLKEEGITLEITNGGGADNTMAAVLSESADIGFCGPEAVIYVANGNSSDSPKVFGQLTKRDGSFLVSRTNEAFDWSRLEGKEILAGRKGGVPAMTFAYVLHEKGIRATLNYDVAFNMMVSAFEGGIADYCTMFEPTASAFEQQGKGYIVSSVGQEAGEIPYTCFMAKESYLSDHADTVEGLLRAVTRAIKLIYEQSYQTTARLLTPWFDGTDEATIATAVANYVKIDAWVRDMTLSASSLTRLQDVMIYADELDERVAYDKIASCDTAHAVYTQVYADV